MTIQELRDKGWIIFESISGSKAYGTDLPTSDTDIRGVFIQPTSEVLKANPTNDGNYSYIPQISDEKNDVVFYEIGRFIELLEKGNPNILELLNVPESCIIYKDEVWDRYFPDPSIYLTKQLRFTFNGYAKTQIKKATGLNKKIRNPQPKQRKDVLDFTYVLGKGTKTIPFWKWLENYYNINIQSQNDKEIMLKYLNKGWGVSKMNNGNQLYVIYPDDFENKLKGILKDLNSTQFILSSIPKSMENSKNIKVWFNQDGFVKHCKDHKEYWEWVENRNQQRYKENVKHKDLGYDLKNIMHTVRLVEMAKDIVEHKRIIVRRPNREELLNIRRGKHDFKFIMKYVDNLIKETDKKFEESDLPERVNTDYTRMLLSQIRMDNLKNEIVKI